MAHDEYAQRRLLSVEQSQARLQGFTQGAVATSSSGDSILWSQITRNMEDRARAEEMAVAGADWAPG